jgi:hypothetical protein
MEIILIISVLCSHLTGSDAIKCRIKMADCVKSTTQEEVLRADSRVKECRKNTPLVSIYQWDRSIVITRHLTVTEYIPLNKFFPTIWAGEVICQEPKPLLIFSKEHYIEQCYKKLNIEDM